MQLSNRTAGLTLIEILVSLVIISILASVALPYAEITVRRNQELELHRALRAIRSAIDDFHRDWKRDEIPAASAAASRYGYPRSLAVLTEGIKLNNGEFRRYLRRIPRNPLADPSLQPTRQWLLRGYEDDQDAMFWNEKDVYDIRVQNKKKALDGTLYSSW